MEDMTDGSAVIPDSAQQKIIIVALPGAHGIVILVQTPKGGTSGNHNGFDSMRP
jgi:hypothetical protein